MAGPKRVKRYRVTDAADPKREWWGTCPKWVEGFTFPVVVTVEHLTAYNSRSESCNQCGGEHAIVPSPL